MQTIFYFRNNDSISKIKNKNKRQSKIHKKKSDDKLNIKKMHFFSI